MEDKKAIEERVSLNLTLLEKTSFDNSQLLHLSIAEDCILLARTYIFEQDVLSSKKYLELALDELIHGFNYKKTPLSERYPNGSIKVRDKVMNPLRGLQMLMIALILKNEDRITESAKLIWDPPFADYIGPNGVCTYDEQAIAHAYRDYVLEDSTEEDLVQILNKLIIDETNYSIYAQTLKALVHRNTSVLNNVIPLLIQEANLAVNSFLALGSIVLLIRSDKELIGELNSLNMLELVLD